MKTYILLFMMFCLKASFALNIENITVTPINSNDINIHLKTGNGYSFYYFSNSINTTGNSITINVCYTMGPLAAVWQNEKDIIIPTINTNTANYTLIVNVYWVDTVAPVACNYTSLQDTATLQFSTPLTQPVYLGNSSIEKDNDFKIYPNPAKNNFNITAKNDVVISSMSIYNTLGQLVQVVTNPTNSIDVSELKTGNYFVKIVSDKGISGSKFLKE